MTIWIGTSNWNYPEWKGSFYPEKMKAAEMLPYYAARFASVEVNNTFYRMPNEKAVQGWTSVTPERFRLTLKAPQRITHFARLSNCADSTAYFLKMAQTLGPKLGSILFQLPPNFQKNLIVLDAFLETLPAGTCAAFEFRNPGWLVDEVYERLKAKNLALCIADSEKLSTPVEITADHAYFRLRDEGYQPADIARWAQVIRDKTAHCREVYVYFKHEDEGKGPEFGKLLMQELGVG